MSIQAKINEVKELAEQLGATDKVSKLIEDAQMVNDLVLQSADLLRGVDGSTDELQKNTDDILSDMNRLLDDVLSRMKASVNVGQV
jgi:hypothetical protein